MTLELSPPVATVSGAVEWLYESDTPTPVVKRDAPLTIPFTVPSSGTIAVVYKPNTRGGGNSARLRVIGVYRDGSPDAVASGSTTSYSGYTDDTSPYTIFATVSEGEHYLQFSTTATFLEFDVAPIRVGHIPDPIVPLLVGVADGWASGSLRGWATSIGKSYDTITEIHVPIKVVGQSLHWLFYGCKALTAVPAFDTRTVTSMHSMFEGCASLTDVPAFDTRNVTIMQSMFYGCTSLASIPDMDTSKVTNMKNMFYNCASLTSVPEFNTGMVTDTSFMFYGCSSLTSIPDMDTSQVTNTIAMFYKCSSLTSIPDIDTSQVLVMNHMFVDCASLTSLPELDTSQATNMVAMFRNCSALTSIPHINTSQVEGMGLMFDGCSALTSVPDLDASKVTDADAMFNGCSSLESVTLTGMGNAFTAGSSETYRTLDMRATKLDAYAANALMNSLGTPPPGGFLKLPATARGADTSIAVAKNWTVTIV